MLLLCFQWNKKNTVLSRIIFDLLCDMDGHMDEEINQISKKNVTKLNLFINTKIYETSNIPLHISMWLKRIGHCLSKLHNTKKVEQNFVHQK
ncbi:hypothetical protein DERP_013814 [Dermatophagoides pteronyssinus]|uniref:Uncharacterized protein n=1 Tax=Dermatophagoides pteronyssinus TaxID=6956 RepID=A0ABQ8JCN3_DERPT|nr:hypothetical protein DERP_013814 [Dermatophagoides pteronyssinus]